MALTSLVAGPATDSLLYASLLSGAAAELLLYMCQCQWVTVGSYGVLRLAATRLIIPANNTKYDFMQYTKFEFLSEDTLNLAVVFPLPITLRFFKIYVPTREVQLQNTAFRVSNSKGRGP